MWFDSVLDKLFIKSERIQFNAVYFVSVLGYPNCNFILILIDNLNI